LTALIAYWTVVCRVPRRLVEAMLADVWSLEMSLGSTQKAWEEVSQAVQQPCQQLQEQLPHQAVLNVDETGWRTNGDKRWIWVFVAKQFVFYVVASTRSAEVLVALLGAVFRGILCSDRWRVYLKYHSGRMHLKRNILGIADNTHSPSAQQFCRDALAVVARLPTMRRSGHCGQRCNGERSVSAIAVAVGKRPRPAYSRSPKPASGSGVTCWVTSRKRYAAIAATLLHPLCSHGGSDP